MAIGKIKTISLLLLCCLPLRAAGAAGEQGVIVNGIDIQGHRAITTRGLLRMLRTSVERPLDKALLERDVETLLSWYRDQGYLSTRIQTPELEYNQDSSRVSLALRIDEGPLVRIGQIEIQGNSWLSREAIENQMDLRPGEIFRNEILEADAERLLAFYENQGHPYCQIEVGGFQLTPEDRLNFALNLKEGPRVRVQSVRPEGNTITKGYVIQRELGIAEDDLYSQRAIERGRRRLQRLGFFKEIGDIEILPGDRPDLVVLRVPVEEGRTNTIDGVVGYQPATEIRDGYFTGLLNLSFRNLMGTGRLVEAAWSRRDPLSSQLRFGYQEPWLLGFPLTVGGHIQQINQDSSYAQTNVELQATSSLGEHLLAGALFGWERVIPDLRGGEDLPSSRTYSLGLRLELDVRDDPWAPRGGGRYRTSVRKRFKENRATATSRPDQSQVESTEFTADVEQYRQIFRRQVLAGGVHLGEIRSDELLVPLNEQFKLGGARTLRGYREEQFHGSRILWADLEYRLLVGRRSWVFLFVDAGHYFYRRRDPLAGAIEEVSGEKVGYGVGLRMESRLGILGVDYGLGEGDGLTDGKVHFGVLNEF